MSDEYDTAERGSDDHPLVARFKATLAEIRSKGSTPPTSMICEKRDELRRKRLELEEEIEGMKDEDPPSIESIEDEAAAATA